MIKFRRALINITLTISASLGMACHSAFGLEDVEPTDSGPPILSEKSFDGSTSMPDYIAFHVLLTMLAGTEDPEFEADLDKALLTRTSEKTGLQGEEAVVFLDKMRTIQEELQAEKYATVRRATCTPTTPEWSNTKASHVLQELDDLRESIYAKYWASTSISLSQEENDAIKEWLGEVKLSTNYVRTDYLAAYGGGESNDARDSLLAFCNM